MLIKHLESSKGKISLTKLAEKLGEDYKLEIKSSESESSDIGSKTADHHIRDSYSRFSTSRLNTSRSSYITTKRDDSYSKSSHVNTSHSRINTSRSKYKHRDDSYESVH